MESRSAQNVWMEIQQKCRELQKSGQTLATLDQGVANVIVAVEDDRILRLSALARQSDVPSPVKRALVEELWVDLARDGEVHLAHVAARRRWILAGLSLGGFALVLAGLVGSEDSDSI